MNEYRSSIEFASPDLPLRDDVRRLGALVGDLLVEQVSAAFLDDVEDVRTRAIARRHILFCFAFFGRSIGRWHRHYQRTKNHHRPFKIAHYVSRLLFDTIACNKQN
jgi:hypothetical protein